MLRSRGGSSAYIAGLAIRGKGAAADGSLGRAVRDIPPFRFLARASSRNIGYGMDLSKTKLKAVCRSTPLAAAAPTKATEIATSEAKGGDAAAGVAA
jgi:hypothetical protein